MWAVQALAQPAESQLTLFPDFAEVADELALEHEEAQQAYLDSPAADSLKAPQQQALEALDNKLETMSGPANEPIWCVQALREQEVWNTVRSLARTVMTEMGWRDEVPPFDRGAIFIGPPLNSRD